MAEDTRVRIGIVALPEATASTVYGIHDFFASVGRDWSLLVEGRPAASAVECEIVAPSRRGMRVANGGWIRPDTDFATAEPPDVVCVPDLGVAPDEALGPQSGRACEWLRRCETQGSIVASACSGALLLAQAGLLDDRDATTHWAYCDALARAHPSIRIHPARCLVESGEGHRIVTAGGGFAWHDLALYLVARLFGEEEAIRQAKLHLIDWHDTGQLPFAVLTRGRQRDDPAVAAAQDWSGRHLRAPRPVAGMTEASGLSERTFKRRFRQATGMTPMEYVHSLRLEEAKHRLETSDEAIERIAIDAGYEDASFFRRLFRRKVGLTPLAYRRRFGVSRLPPYRGRESKSER